ncbi:nuclear transport factor 2 family protein, partial [Streptomyces spongiae]|nr:nuclear transport factor 2 family protein [Streptomyces spongiae]
MSWTRGGLAALAVCALLGLVAGCGEGGTHERRAGVSASPVGKVLKDTDEKGRHYREIDEKDAPELGIEVQPDGDDGWDVRLTVRNFRFSPTGAKPLAVVGRGTAVLYLDGCTLARLRTTEY